MARTTRAPRLRLLAAGGLCAVALFALIGGAPLVGEHRSEIGTPAGAPYLTIFLVDGMRQDVFESELAAGRLPNMAALARSGAWVRRGISAFPSMTGYAYYPILTGRDAASGGPLGLRWFDRSAPRGNMRNYVGGTRVQMNADLAPMPPTLFERVGGAHSFAINSMLDRGARTSVETGSSYAVAKYGPTWALTRLLASIPMVGPAAVPSLGDVEERVLELAVADLANRPKVQLVTFLSPDAYCHINGLGRGYVDTVRNADRLIGLYRAASERLGQEEDRIYTIISDHGVVAASRHVDLRDPLAAAGVAIHRDPAMRLWSSGFDEEIEEAYPDSDGILAVNGNTMVYLYLRNPRVAGPTGLRRRLTGDQVHAYPGTRGVPVDLVDVIRRVEGVDLVACRGPQGSVEVWTAQGSGLIRTRDGQYGYEPSGRDPLGYVGTAATALLDGGYHDPREWLEATSGLSFPYAVVRLARLFEQAGCGDLVVTARDGFDLAPDFELFIGSYRGGHGGLRADQLRVPYLLAGPGVRRGVEIEAALAEDLGATLHELLGLDLPAAADGVVLEGAVEREEAKGGR